MSSVRATFLDCDGVIFDSNPAKRDAYRHALAEYPREAVERLVGLHVEEGGVSRYAKLQRFFQEIHPVADVDAAIARALERFGEASRAAYRELKPIPEALAYAERMGGPRSVYVVSGADGEELREVFAEHGILDRFAEVLGSPTKKRDHVLRVLAERSIAPEEALMVGDGKAEFECAVELGIPFVFLAEMSEWKDGIEIVSRAPNARIARTWKEV